MKYFLDVNVVMEFLANRELGDEAEKVIRSAEQGIFIGCISAMTFDTITYLVGVDLKKQGLHEPQKRERTREMLNNLLGFITVVDISQDFLSKGLNDKSFKDLEDAYQYYCAVENECDGIITINAKDFVGKHEEKVSVYSLTGFVDKYIVSD